MVTIRRRPVLTAAVLAFALIGSPAARSAAPDDDFLYRAQPGDTLIGLGRKLLVDPQKWHDVQERNHIVNPRRIPPGGILRIPYSWLQVTAQTARVTALAGAVRSGTKVVGLGDVLPQGAVIETGLDGSVTLDLADGSVVTIQKSSVVRLDEMTQVSAIKAANSIRLKLDSGRVETKVTPHRDVGRFEIVTPVAVSAVRGTEFRNGFSAAEAHATTETLGGIVAVGNGVAAVQVPAGFGTRVEKDGQPLPAVSLLPPPDLSVVAETNATAALQVRLPAVPGARRYRLQLSTDAEFHALTVDVESDDGLVTVPDLADGDYFLRARSIDPLGLEGPDAVRALRQHVLPPPPTVVSPSARQQLIAGPVRLVWTPGPAPALYTVQVASEPSFATPLYERANIEGGAVDVRYLPAGTYCWRVAAVNGRSEAGPWSEAQCYVLQDPAPMPHGPTIEGKRLSVIWEGKSDHTYRAQIAADREFNRVIDDERLVGPEWAVPKPAPGIYFTRVQRIEADGTSGPFGPSRRFAVPVPTWIKVALPMALGLALLL